MRVPIPVEREDTSRWHDRPLSGFLASIGRTPG